VAVEAFLAGRVPFTAILDTVERVLGEHRAGPVETLDDALGWDEWGRARARETLQSCQ
jgi:1-deoxy-D-xylulose-5-phosphate reductoisomerase